MNRLQAIVLGVAAGNIAVMLLFPPYDSLGIGRGGTQSFDAFYFALDSHPGKIVNSSLLLIELYWVIANAAIAWLLLGRTGDDRLMSRRTAVLAIGAANLAVAFLFPPFENYASTLRFSSPHFDGFYFVFGDKAQRRFYVPLLYLETVWILINIAILWLALREPEKRAPQAF